MRILRMNANGGWNELSKYTPTEEESVILKSKAESDSNARNEIIKKLKSIIITPATEKDASVATEKYESVKPKLKEADRYQVISVDMTISENETKDVFTCNGILNCLVNNTQEQIRF